MSLIIPQNYQQKLMPETTELAIKTIKDNFQKKLSEALNLRRVTAPLFVLSGTGLNDDLNGIERAVTFPVKAFGDRRAEVVHSLAKWKRVKLGAYRIDPGYGLYTDMNAIRADEELDNLHSLYVDQWDWEKTITLADRNLDYLKQTVKVKRVGDSVRNPLPRASPKNWLNNALFCLLAGALWYSQFFGLALGKGFLTESPTLFTFAFCILMALNVVFSNLWGIILKEWKGCNSKTILTLVVGLIILIVSSFIPQFI